jgi:hypothetical protein
MILVYRPELENPPMDKECSIGFSFIGEKGAKAYINLQSGVTRDFPEEAWTKIQNYDVVRNLLNLGALRVDTDAPAETATAVEVDVDTIAGYPLNKAMSFVEDSFDVDQLRRWDAKEARIRVKNSISRRIRAITEGNG